MQDRLEREIEPYIWNICEEERGEGGKIKSSVFCLVYRNSFGRKESLKKSSFSYDLSDKKILKKIILRDSNWLPYFFVDF